MTIESILHPRRPCAQPRRASVSGFTLVELLVVVAIVAIVARFAIPAYTASIYKAHRSDAKTALLDLAAREERYFTQYNTYSSTASALGYGASTTFPVNLPGGSATTDYTLTVSAASATAYTLTATPAGSQADDTICSGYQLDNFGNQTNFGNSGSATGCW
jgi:type IV pilus assembly protein PilE